MIRFDTTVILFYNVIYIYIYINYTQHIFATSSQMNLHFICARTWRSCFSSTVQTKKTKRKKIQTGYKSNKSKSFTYVKARFEYTQGAYIILFYLFSLPIYDFILKGRSQRFTYA